MPKTFQLSILSPRGRALEGSADALVVPTPTGELGVLADHAPLLASLVRGVTKVTQDGQTRFWVTGSGILEVSLKGVHVLVDNAEPASDLDAAKSLLVAHRKETGDGIWS